MEIDQFDSLLQEKSEYLYILIEPRFIAAKKSVAKIGRTSRSILTRFKEYPRNSVLLGVGRVPDCVTGEKILIDEFKKQYKRKLKYGLEYFSGSLELMEATFHEVVLDLKSKVIDKPLISLSSVQANHSMQQNNDMVLNNGDMSIESLTTEISLSNSIQLSESSKTSKKLRCPKCKKLFKEKGWYEKHLETVDCTKMYTCGKCNAAYKKKDHLESHNKRNPNCAEAIKTSNGDFICGCGKSFSTNGNLAKHKRTCTKKDGDSKIDQMMKMMKMMEKMQTQLDKIKQDRSSSQIDKDIGISINKTPDPKESSKNNFMNSDNIEVSELDPDNNF